MMHFNCPPLSANPGATSLDFSWDPVSGVLSGRDADRVRAMAAWTTVDAHPMPWDWTLTDPLHSYTDMAAIVGSHWLLPPELAPHYPQIEMDVVIPEATYVDADGVTVLGRDQLVY